MANEHGFFTDLEEKALSEGDDCWTLTGYGAVFYNKDRGKDIIDPGTFAESLKSLTPAFLHEHQMDQPPVGNIVEAREDRKGVFIKAELPKDDTFVSGRIIPQIKRRGLKGMSIGYRVQESKREGDTRIIKKAMLFEVSLVKIPMNPLAGVESLKNDIATLGIDEWKNLSDREREAHLKTLFSDGLAKQIVRLARDGRTQTGQREAGEARRSFELPDLASLIRNAAQRP